MLAVTKNIEVGNTYPKTIELSNVYYKTIEVTNFCPITIEVSRAQAGGTIEDRWIGLRCMKINRFQAKIVVVITA